MDVHHIFENNFEYCIDLTFSRMALYARKYDVSEKINQSSTKRTNRNLRENLVARKCPLRLDARKFSCAKISTFTVYNLPPVHANVLH